MITVANGELSTTVKFGAKDGSWSVTLQVLQFISQSVPSLGLQEIIVTNRTATIKNITLVPKLTSFGLPGAALTVAQDKGLPTDIFHLGRPDPLLMRSNSGAEVAVTTQAKSLACDCGIFWGLF